MRRIVPMYSGICADVASISVEHNTKKSDVSPDVSRRSTVHRAAAGGTFLWDKVQQRTPGNHHRINPVRWMTWAPEPTGVWHLPDVAGLPRMMTRHDRTWGPPWDCGLLNGCLAVCFMEEMSGQCSWWQKHIYIYIPRLPYDTHDILLSIMRQSRWSFLLLSCAIAGSPPFGNSMSWAKLELGTCKWSELVGSMPIL